LIEAHVATRATRGRIKEYLFFIKQLAKHYDGKR